MSAEYDAYLNKHISAVRHNATWFFDNIDESTMNDIFPNASRETVEILCSKHDASKYNPKEYDAYDQFFYFDGKNSPEGRLKFDFAFLLHIRANPHHWQYWVLIHDEGTDTIDGRQIQAFDMPDDYILEMIADWWSFSYNLFLDTKKYESLYEVFDWYDKHRTSIVFSPSTRTKVERFLEVLKTVLDNIKWFWTIQSDS